MSALAFDIALSVLWVNEGVDANDPDDAGGLTRFGISQAAYPDLDIRALTREDAAAIYRRDYWEPIHGDELPLRLAVQTFDHAVNAGPAGAVRLLQCALRVAADGVIGPATIAAARSQDRQGPETSIALAEERISFYAGLILRKPGQSKFGKGWRRRVLRTLRTAELAASGVVADL